MDFTHAAGFYAAPFPSEHRRTDDDTVDVSAFPNPLGNAYVAKLLELARTNVDGFGATSAIYFGLSGPVDPARLPDLHRSVAPDAPVFVMSVERAAPDYLKRYPVSVRFDRDAGPYGAPNLLSLLPLQGMVLRPATLYAAVVLRGLGGDAGRPLRVSLAMRQLAAGVPPQGLGPRAFQAYRAALDGLSAAGVGSADIAGLAVFRTGTPAAQFRVVRDDVLSRPAPNVDSAFLPDEVFDEYCVYHTSIRMPNYQQGTPPYLLSGGTWAFDPAGKPIVQGTEQADFVVTIPRRAMPAAGFPVAALIRAGAGGERPLVDRGTRVVAGGPAILPGTGPALFFARAGFAGVSIDGPHGGRRNVTQGDEQFLVFNLFNPAAMLDNIRQSALETLLWTRILENVTLDASSCTGVSPSIVKFDTSTLALMGHSTGASIAPLALAFEPRYRAAILSGSGGSWIENTMYKLKPIPPRPVAEALVGYAAIGRNLTEQDPALNLFQWVMEAADTPIYSRSIIQEPLDGASRHVLMFQGIMDNYIPPPVANAQSLSLGVDLAGVELDRDPMLQMFTPLGDLLDLGAMRAIALPAQGNVAGADAIPTTAVVIQHRGDGIEDGHEVVFQADLPKHQYQCFLESFALGASPRVPADGTVLEPCVR
jgi:hypothetical protein